MAPRSSVSYIILALCALEASYWVVASANSAHAVDSESSLVASRWSQNIQAHSEPDTTSDGASTAKESLNLDEGATFAEPLPPKCGSDPRCKIRDNQQSREPDGLLKSAHPTREGTSDGSPKQSRGQGKFLVALEEISSLNHVELASYPLFVWLSVLFLVVLCCHGFAQYLADAQHIVASLMRPILVVQAALFGVILDVMLLAIFGACVRHLGQCSHDMSCMVASVDGTAVAVGLVSLLALVQCRGGQWLLQAMGLEAKIAPFSPTVLAPAPSATPSPIDSDIASEIGAVTSPLATDGSVLAVDGTPTRCTPSCGAASPLAVLVWPSILLLPLYMTCGERYRDIFPEEWYAAPEPGQWPSALGLSLGISAVAVGQIFALLYHILRVKGYLGALIPIQRKGAPTYPLASELLSHLAQPEGFAMLGCYLSGTWMMGWMPASYYSFEGGVQWELVALQLLCQDGIQYLMHRIEHKASPALYQASHKPHHRWTNPKLFDAFNGSAADTFLMILVPLFATAHLVQGCNVWTYMAFGSLYANWLTLIHSEFAHPWDAVFRSLGLGTAADHHIHHALFIKNYGHLFMYFDWVCGTYKDPATCSKFNSGV